MNEANRLRILYFLVFCCTASWLPILENYCKENGLSGIQRSVIINLAPLMIFLVQPFYGMVADKWGYKKSLLLSSFFASVSYILYLYGNSFWYLFVITACMAFFYNGIQPILDSLSLTLTQKNKKFSYGTLRIAGAVGWALTGIITGKLIDATDTTVIFIIAGVSMFLTFLIAFFLQTDKKELTSSSQSFEHVRELFQNKSLIFLLVCVALISAGTSAIWYFYFTYMKENGASASLIGYGLSFQGLCELPLFYFSARIIARFGMKRTLLFTIFASIVRLLLYSAVKNPVAAIPIEMLHGFSWSLFWVVCVECVNKLVKEEWRATGQSLLYASYYGVGIIVGNFWTGYLADTNMRVSEIFLLNAGILVFVAVIVWVFMRTKASSTDQLSTHH
jgi:MFS transporter, PPP family, 3-phenylpropionic acid transporter